MESGQGVKAAVKFRQQEIESQKGSCHAMPRGIDGRQKRLLLSIGYQMAKKYPKSLEIPRLLGLR